MLKLVGFLRKIGKKIKTQNPNIYHCNTSDNLRTIEYV